MALIKCPECGHDISDKAQKCVRCGYCLNEKTKYKKTNKKAVIGIITFASVILLGVFILISYFNNSLHNNVETEIEQVKDYLSKSRAEIIVTYDNVIMDGDSDLYINGDFAGMKGQYEICTYDDGDVWRVIFEPDEASNDVKSVVKAIEKSLGKYDEYNSEYDYYEWNDDEIEIEYYTEERVYFDPPYNY